MSSVCFKWFWYCVTLFEISREDRDFEDIFNVDLKVDVPSSSSRGDHRSLKTSSRKRQRAKDREEVDDFIRGLATKLYKIKDKCLRINERKTINQPNRYCCDRQHCRFYAMCHMFSRRLIAEIRWILLEQGRWKIIYKTISSTPFLGAYVIQLLFFFQINF